jgi:hypothetical protein
MFALYLLYYPHRTYCLPCTVLSTLHILSALYCIIHTAHIVCTVLYYPHCSYCLPYTVLSTLHILFALYCIIHTAHIVCPILYYPHCTYCLHCTVLCTMYWNSLQADFFKDAGNLAKLKLLTLCCSHWQRCLYMVLPMLQSQNPQRWPYRRAWLSSVNHAETFF